MLNHRKGRCSHDDEKPPTMLAAASPEWAVKSHGCDTKSLRRVRGFRVVPVEWAIKTIFGYDLNLLIEIIANVCLPNLSPR